MGKLTIMSTKMVCRVLATVVLSLIAVQAAADLEVWIEANPDPVRPGDFLRIELTVTNNGSSSQDDTILRMPMQPQFNLIRDSTQTSPGIMGNGTCPGGGCFGNEDITWDIGHILEGESITFGVNAQISSGVTNGTPINLEAIVEWDFVLGIPTGDDNDSHTVTVETAAPLVLALDEDRDPVLRGENLTYRLTYGNRGATDITGATLHFPLPGNSNFSGATGAGTQNGNAVDWTLDTVAAGETGRESVTVQVPSGTARGTAYPANAVLSGMGTQIESARATATTIIVDTSPIHLAMEIHADPLIEAANIKRTELRAAIVASNTGSLTIQDATIAVRVPEEVASFQDSNASTPQVTGNVACPGSACFRPEFAIWDLGNLSPGETSSVAFWTRFLSTSNGFAPGHVVTLDTFVIGNDGSRLLQARMSQSVSFDDDASLTLAIDPSADPVSAGDSLSYLVTFGNRGTSAVTGATLRLPLPANTQLVGAGGGTLVNNEVVWTIGTLAAGAINSRTAVVMVDSNAADGTLLSVNQAVLNGMTVEPEFAYATTATRVAADSGLRLSVSNAPNPTPMGTAIATTIEAKNVSAFSIDGVVVKARVPSEFSSFAEPVSPVGTCPGSACSQLDLVTWDLGTLAAGATVTMPIATTVLTNGDWADGDLYQVETEARDTADNVITASDAVGVGTFVDTDGDGIADSFDNCTVVPNGPAIPDAGGNVQLDSNGDGYGNVCDADLNNDGVINGLDVGPFVGQFGTAGPDADFNGDGVVNGLDVGPFVGMFGQAPGPSGIAP